MRRLAPACLLLAALLLSASLVSRAAAYEPISGTDVVYYSIRATKLQRERLAYLAFRAGVDADAIAQQRYGAASLKFLTLAQAAELIHELESRGQYDISRPHSFRNWASAWQDNVYNTITWPMMRFFRM